MVESMETSEADLSENSKKLRNNVLSSFQNLGNESEKKRIESALLLVDQLNGKNDQEKEEDDMPLEVKYACGRLVRGLGSRREFARKGYYAAFAAFLTRFSSFTLEDLTPILDKELALGKFNGKGEEGDVCFGRILAYGALIRSGAFYRLSSKEQTYIISQMIELSTKKSYLPQLISSFLMKLIEEAEESSSRDILCPALQPLIAKPWAEQTLDTLHLILVINRCAPKVMKKMKLRKLLGAQKFICSETLSELATILFNFVGTSWQGHPVYEEFCRQITKSSTLAIEFWSNQVEPQLLGSPKKKSDAKGTLAIELFRLFSLHLSRDHLPQLLSPKCVTFLSQRLEHSPLKTENERRAETVIALETLTDILKSPETSDDIRAQCLERIVLVSSHNFGFDKYTKMGTVHAITLSMARKGLEKVANLYKSVIDRKTKPIRIDKDDSVGELDDSTSSSWVNKDRIAAVHLLTNIILHPDVETDFRTQLIIYILEKALFPEVGSQALCSAAKEGLLRCLGTHHTRSHAHQPLALMKQRLIEIVTFIHNQNKKCPKRDIDIKRSWDQMMANVNELETLVNSDKNILKVSHQASVLQVLFMHLGIQLYVDPVTAIDALEELHVCVEKAGITKKIKAIEKKGEEPDWIEVVTDIFLSLLAQNSSSLRNIVGMVFRALCPFMTEDSLFNLVNALDMTSGENPLQLKSDQNIESGSEESASDEESSVEEEEEEMEEDDIPPESDDERETVSDKVRAAVRQALGECAYQTDEESINVDDISEEEGQKLDEALSEAFKTIQRNSTQKALTKKQARENKELLHFRVRSADLVLNFIQSEQSMSLTLGLIPPLFSALEVCLKDPTMKPLEMRLRACLKALIKVRKFVVTDGVDNKELALLLMGILEKGNRTIAVFMNMSEEICTVCAFLVRCSIILSPDQTCDLSNPIIKIYTDSLITFFYKRDCLLPPTFFSTLLSMNWTGNFALWPILISAAFKDPNVRPFRKSQAINLLKTFSNNAHLLSQHLEEKIKFGVEVCKHSAAFLLEEVKILDSANARHQRFLPTVRLIQTVINNCKNDIDWKILKSAVATYLSSCSTIPKEWNKPLKTLRVSLGIKDGEVPNREIKKRKILVSPKNDSKRSRKEKNAKDNNGATKQNGQMRKLERKSKKEAKQLRFNTLSSGLEDLSFSNLPVEDS